MTEMLYINPHNFVLFSNLPFLYIYISFYSFWLVEVNTVTEGSSNTISQLYYIVCCFESNLF